MPTKRPRLSFDQHKELGNRLKRMREELFEIHGALWGIVPAKKLNRMIRGVEDVFQVRHELEIQMFKDHPEKASPKTYFGPSDS